MEKQNGRERSTGSQERHGYDDIFQDLPPLGSDEYLAHIRSTPTSTLPPEVLVRAFRQLPPGGVASKATLERLFLRQPDGRWDYVGALVAYARRQSRMPKRDSYEDLLQQAFQRILETLPTSRGEFAQRSWNAFCRRELSDAWRERYGRRGERFPLEEPLDLAEEGEETDPISVLSDPPLWHATVKPSQVPAIEAIARRVVSEIQDEFVSTVASETWFKNKRPKVSGHKTSDVPEKPLTDVFAGKSRFQITRALRHADAQLAAALVAEPDLKLTLDLETLLKELKSSSRPLRRPAKERK